MEGLLAGVLGVMFASAVYLLLRRSLVKLILGVAMLSQAVNLLIFVAAGLKPDGAPFVPVGADVLPAGAADPLPQALILTAIVISFGVMAFLLVMLQCADKAAGSDDLDDLTSTDTQ